MRNQWATGGACRINAAAMYAAYSGPPRSSDQALRRPARSIMPKISAVATNAVPAEANESALEALKSAGKQTDEEKK